MVIPGGQDLLDVRAQVRERRDVKREELARAIMTSKWRREDIRLPPRLDIQPFDEGLRIVGVPSCESLSDDMEPAAIVWNVRAGFETDPAGQF
jgi:hypothetical protein